MRGLEENISLGPSSFHVLWPWVRRKNTPQGLPGPFSQVFAGFLALRLKGFSLCLCPACFLSLRAVRSIHRDELHSQCRAEQVKFTSCGICTFHCDTLWFILQVLLTPMQKRNALEGVPLHSEFLNIKVWKVWKTPLYCANQELAGVMMGGEAAL